MFNERPVARVFAHVCSLFLCSFTTNICTFIIFFWVLLANVDNYVKVLFMIYSACEGVEFRSVESEFLFNAVSIVEGHCWVVRVSCMS